CQLHAGYLMYALILVLVSGCLIVAPMQRGDEQLQVRAMLLDILDSTRGVAVPHEVAITLKVEDVVGPAIDLARTHPDFERDDPARVPLVQTLLMVRDAQGRGPWAVRGTRGDFLVEELRTGAI